MNRRFHRWLDNHEIVKLFFMVVGVVAPSILLCLVGPFPLCRVAKYGRLAFIGAGVTWAAIWVFSRFHYLYRG